LFNSKKLENSGVDTTDNANTEPDKEQPWQELGLKKDEYEEIKRFLVADQPPQS